MQLYPVLWLNDCMIAPVATGSSGGGFFDSAVGSQFLSKSETKSESPKQAAPKRAAPTASASQGKSLAVSFASIPSFLFSGKNNVSDQASRLENAFVLLLAFVDHHMPGTVLNCHIKQEQMSLVEAFVLYFPDQVTLVL